MKSIGNFFSLCKTFLRFKAHELKEERSVKRAFYSQSNRFKQIDTALKRQYLFCNPYQISKRFLMARKEEDVHTYGETDLTALALIAKESGLGPSDHLVELGSGRGRGLFFLSELFGCQATGIEWNPHFVSKAMKVKEKLNVSRVHFLCHDFSEADLSEATHIYLYGTCLSDPVIEKIIERFSSLKKGVKIITVSYSLLDYNSSDFVVKKEIEMPFPWGMADVYFHEKV